MDEFNMDAFLDALDELEKLGGGEGGLFGQFEFGVAYFIYSGEVPQDERCHEFDPTDTESRNKAKEDAEDTMEEHGVEVTKENRPQISYIFKFPKATAKGITAERAEGWAVDERVFATPVWADAAKEVSKPAVKELGLKPGKHWGRISFAEDPGGRTETGLDGEEKIRLVAFPAETYENEAACEDAAGGNGNESAEPFGGIPTKFRKEVINDYEALRAEGLPPKKAVAKVAEDWEYANADVLDLVS